MADANTKHLDEWFERLERMPGWTSAPTST